MTVKVDLLPSERKRPKLIDGVTIFLIFVLLAVGGGLFYYKVTLDNQIAEKKAKIEELQKEIEQLAPLKLKIDQYKQLTQSIKQQVELLKSLRDDPKNYSTLLGEVTKIIPKNVWIENLEIQPGSKNVKCTCKAVAGNKDGLAIVALFMRNIIDSPTFSNPVVSGISRNEDSKGFILYNFNMTANYVIAGGGGTK
ncbi:MAG: PilN domain-containing protein [Candidatus Eremiobacterota bacterium]